MIDTHVHSHHSPDAKGAMLTFVEAAQSRGLTGVAFTEHGEWYPGDEAYGYLDLNAYFAEIDAVRAQCCAVPALAGGFSVLAGIELGNPHEFPERIAPLLMRYPFDIVIGSVHWIDNLPGWEPAVFEAGMQFTYQRYFEELLLLVEQAEFDILGHFDLVRRDSWDLFRQVLSIEPYAEIVDAILRRLIADGRGLEINTSGLRKGLSEPVPGLAILRRYRELGGEILVIGSDAHYPEHVAHGFDLARDVALAAGFEHIACFEQRHIIGWMDIV